jgi:hypothetical protein
MSSTKPDIDNASPRPKPPNVGPIALLLLHDSTSCGKRGQVQFPGWILNPSIRDEEIEFFEIQQREALRYIAQATLEPQAARVIITTQSRRGYGF